MDTFRSQCPIVARTDETFVEYITIGGERRREEFTKPILWLQQSESVLQFMHGGEVIDEMQRTNDHYGYLTSCDLREPGPVDIAAKYGVTAQSSLELVVKTSVFRQPATETAATLAENAAKPRYVPSYCYVPSNWRKEVLVEGESGWIHLECIDVVVGITWTSKNTPEQNAELVAEFRKTWAASALTAAAAAPTTAAA